MPVIQFIALLTIAWSVQGSDKLPIALCTPENSPCLLASDGILDTCFSANHIETNFYFAMFNTVGQPVTVDKLLVKAGRGGGRTHYVVSLGIGSDAHELTCSMAEAGGDNRTTTDIACPAGLANVTAMMIYPEPLETQLNLLEVAAFYVNGTAVNFTYCVAPDAATCEPAMDFQTAADSPAVTSAPTQNPGWYGGLPGPEPLGTVKIYRPTISDPAEATFFRVNAASECDMVGHSTLEAGSVEVLEFLCSGEPANLLQVWEIAKDFLIDLCEVEVYGQ